MSLPVMLNVTNKKVLIVGGGKIGTRKAISLYEAGALITCLSVDFTHELEGMSGKIVLKNKSFEDRDITAYFLVIAATNEVETNKKVYELCSERNILCQTVDRYNESDFDFLATHKWQDLVIAVSTYGKAPKFSKDLIKALSETISEEQLLQLGKEITEREKLFNVRKAK